MKTKKLVLYDGSLITYHIVEMEDRPEYMWFKTDHNNIDLAAAVLRQHTKYYGNMYSRGINFKARS